MNLSKLLFITSLSIVINTSSLQADIVEQFDFPKNGQLTKRMQDFYEKNGFLIFDDYLTPEECDSLSAKTDELIQGFNPTPDSIEIFAAKNDAQENRGRYFQDSVDKISFFYEEKAFKDGNLVVDKIDAINKLGHAVGENEPKFRSVTFRDSVRKIAEQLGVSDPRLNQSMVICKPKYIGGEVSPHQDSTFLYTYPNSTLAFWIPLENATTENGCLWAIPGSQKWELLTRYVKNPKGPGFITQDKHGKALSDTEIAALYNSHWLEKDFVALPMKKGSVIIFPGNLVHKSGANLSNKSRKAYTFHLMSGHSEYPADNWLQRADFALIMGSEETIR
jgi:phytanoyl-CoA hydroxylase